jgi:hypothetical protein
MRNGVLLLAAMTAGAVACDAQEQEEDACERAACEALKSPVDNASIDQGIAGVIVGEADEATDVCTARCWFDSSTLLFFETDAPVYTTESAQSLLRSRAPDLEVPADGTYEQALDAGDYLACAFGTHDGLGVGGCAPFEVHRDRVTTVHVWTNGYVFWFFVYSPDGATEVPTFLVEVPEVEWCADCEWGNACVATLDDQGEWTDRRCAASGTACTECTEACDLALCGETATCVDCPAVTVVAPSIFLCCEL